MPGLGTRPGASRDRGPPTCFNTDLSQGSGKSVLIRELGGWLACSDPTREYMRTGPLPISTGPSYGIADQWMRLRLGSIIVVQLRFDKGDKYGIIIVYFFICNPFNYHQ